MNKNDYTFEMLSALFVVDHIPQQCVHANITTLMFGLALKEIELWKTVPGAVSALLCFVLLCGDIFTHIPLGNVLDTS